MQEMQEMQVRSLSREDPLEKEMATHSSILAWRIPCLEEQQKTGHNQLTEHTYILTLKLITGGLGYQILDAESPHSPSLYNNRQVDVRLMWWGGFQGPLLHNLTGTQGRKVLFIILVIACSFCTVGDKEGCQCVI